MTNHDLVEFLRARFDEDETAARDQGYRMLDAPDVSHFEHGDGRVLVFSVHRDLDPLELTDAEFFDHYCEPVPPDARALAEVDSKRRIVNEIVPEVREFDEQIAAEWGGGVEGTDVKLLRLIAAVYSHHPDYREEWRT